tara:strand:- start:9955 stop:10185 length:231 start_codon:yes stop_codon:yes gene_type:complete
MEIPAYGLMAAGGIVFVVNWWRIIREGYHLQQMYSAGTSAGGGGLSSRWRFFLIRALYSFCGFAALLAGVLMSKSG